MISRLPPTIECPQSLNCVCGGSECYTAMNCIVLFLNRVFRSQSLQSNLVYNFTNMHVVSYRSDLFTCSCRVNIQEPAVSFPVSLLSVVFRFGLPSCQIPTAMSDSESSNTSLLEVVVPSKDERFIICDLSNLTSQINFDAWRASMNGDSKRAIAWNNSENAPS